MPFQGGYRHGLARLRLEFDLRRAGTDVADQAAVIEPATPRVQTQVGKAAELFPPGRFQHPRTVVACGTFRLSLRLRHNEMRKLRGKTVLVFCHN